MEHPRRDGRMASIVSDTSGAREAQLKNYSFLRHDPLVFLYLSPARKETVVKFREYVEMMQKGENVIVASAHRHQHAPNEPGLSCMLSFPEGLDADSQDKYVQDALEKLLHIDIADGLNSLPPWELE